MVRALENNDDYTVEKLSDSSIDAVARARVSEGSEDEIRNSIQSQKDGIKELAIRLNVGKIYWFIEEEAVSAYKNGGDTPLFVKARAFACENKDVQYFLQWDQTRFCRDSFSSKKFKRELRKAGVAVRFVSGDIVEENTGAAVIVDAVQEALAEADGIEKGKHVLRGSITNARNRDPQTKWNYKNGGSPAYGYKRERVECGKKSNGDPLLKTIWLEDDEIIHCEINSKFVSKTKAAWAKYILIDLRLKKGLGFDRIRDHLNEIGLPAPRKKYWSDTTICEMTKNIAYIGTYIYNKRNYSSQRRGMGMKIKDVSEFVVEKDAHPALITEEQYSLLQKMAKPANKGKRKSRKNKADSPYLLSFNFICDSCGGTIIGNRHSYVCGTYQRKGKKACGAPSYSIPQDWIEEEIIKQIGLTLDDSIVDMIVKNRIEQYKEKVDTKDIDALRRKLDENIQSRTNLLKALELGKESDSNAVHALMDRLAVLEKQIKGCEEEISLITKPKIVKNEKEIRAEVEDLSIIFEKASYEQKRQIIQLFINSVKLDPINKSVVVERFLYPQLSLVENKKGAQTKSIAPNSSDFDSIQYGCGGRI